jgi:hypothetical protein
VEEQVKEAEIVVLESAEGGGGCVEGGSDSGGTGVGVGEGGCQQHGVFLVPAVPVDRYPITNSLMEV